MNKIKTTDYLITANTTALLAYVFVFQTQIDNTIVKWLIFISFSFFVVSLCLMVWYRFRYPQRNKYYKELVDESTKKIKEGIVVFIEGIILPYTRTKTRNDVLERLAKVKSEEEYRKFQRSLKREIKNLEANQPSSLSAKPDHLHEKAIESVVESYLLNLEHDSKEHFVLAFKKPLKESYAKQKLVLDIISFKYRVHVFVSAAVFLAASIAVQLVAS